MIKKFKESSLLPKWYKLKVGEFEVLTSAEIAQLPFALMDIRDSLEYHECHCISTIFIDRIYGQFQIGLRVFRIVIDCLIRVDSGKSVDDTFKEFLDETYLFDYNVSVKRVRNLGGR